MRIKCKKVELFKQEMKLKKTADRTTTLFRNKFKYTMETKKIKYSVGKKLFKNVIWRSSPLDCIKYCDCETIKLH
jgi:hypothetical protein